LAIERRSELRLDTSGGRSTGTTFGSEQNAATATWFSQPLDHWRATARAEDASAEFPEGPSHLRRVGGGAEFRSDHWRGSALALRRTDGENDVGFAFGGERRLSDRWRLAASLDFDSSETPLRGRPQELRTDVFALVGDLRPSESSSASFGWQRRNHSDGNDGETWFARGWFRVHNTPRFKLDVTGDVSTASNATNEVIYFSPRHDLFGLAGLRHTARLHRHAERSFTQVVDIAAGRYDQAGLASNAIWRAGYRLQLTFSESFGVEIGAERSKMFYDGAPEYATSMSFGLVARL
jgi:hypothetical protein